MRANKFSKLLPILDAMTVTPLIAVGRIRMALLFASLQPAVNTIATNPKQVDYNAFGMALVYRTQHFVSKVCTVWLRHQNYPMRQSNFYDAATCLAAAITVGYGRGERAGDG